MGGEWNRERTRVRGKRAIRFYISKEGVLRDGRARGRNAADKGETENAYPSSPVFDDPAHPSADGAAGAVLSVRKPHGG